MEKELITPNEIIDFIDNYINLMGFRTDKNFSKNTSHWRAILTAVAQRFFVSENYFYSDSKQRIYNIDLVVSDYYIKTYIYICNIYSVLYSLSGYCNFININEGCIYTWLRENKLNYEQRQLLKSIEADKIKALVERMENDNTPIVQITLHNDRAQRQLEQQEEISVEKLPTLTLPSLLIGKNDGKKPKKR